MDAQRVKGRDSTSCRVPEANHDGLEMAAVVTGRADQAHRMQDRAVPGELVVHMEDVDDETPRLRPVIHRLPRYERQPFVDTDLRQLGVLDGMRPAPENLSFSKAGDIIQGGLGQQYDVAGRDDLLTRTNAADQGRQMLVGDPVALAVR